MLATLEWGAREILLERLPSLHGPRAQAITDSNPSQEELSYPLIDPLLGWGGHNGSEANQSVVVLKSSRQPSKKILILGGSTSDLHYNTHSWPYHLSSLFDKANQAVDIHVGAVAGYNSHQELLKIMRDARLTDYDLILSYTGANESVDTSNEHPFTPYYTQYFMHRALPPSKIFYGISRLLQKWSTPFELSFGPKDKLSLKKRFLTNIKSAHALSKVYGANYFAILQPYLSSGQRAPSPREERLMKKPIIQELIVNNDKLYQALQNEAREIDYLHDGTHFLDQLEQAFYDDCHINQQGQKIVAQKVLQAIKTQRLLE